MLFIVHPDSQCFSHTSELLDLVEMVLDGDEVVFNRASTFDKRLGDEVTCAKPMSKFSCMPNRPIVQPGPALSIKFPKQRHNQSASHPFLLFINKYTLYI